ncbi:unnamed protein product [Blepharisma stoltei]|uniref:Uncharacterized protein n=1 Tax=Blepharisma stoltei TaxID=1481888 RepID=A0AAU9ICZ3_9CILI|nr:unnamed protein product [Blepharisma stoltei]
MLISFIGFSSFCFINIFYLYDQCAEYLSNRPEVIRNLIHAQILYTNLVIWKIQSFTDNLNYPICAQVYYMCPFYKAKAKIDEILLSIESTTLDLRKTK